MTDTEIVTLLAEKVMGWDFPIPHSEPLPIGGEWWAWPDGKVRNCRGVDWNPLASDADAFMVWDKMRSDGYYARLHELPHKVVAEFNCPYGPCEKHGHADNTRGHGALVSWREDRRSAIALAALKACGVEGE